MSKFELSSEVDSEKVFLVAQKCNNHAVIQLFIIKKG